MIGIFNDAGERLPIIFNTGLRLNEAIGGDPAHLYEVNEVMVRDVFSGTLEPRPVNDGTEVYGMRKSAKLVRIDGIMRAPTFTALSDMSADLRGALDPAALSKVDTVGHGFAPLEFTVLNAAGAQESYVLARPVSTPDDMWNQYIGKNQPFRLEFFCADPRRYLLTSTVHVLAGSTTVVVANNGNYPSIPTISILMSGTGASTFRISNNTHDPDGQVYLDLSGVLLNDVIVIYPNEKVVTLNGARADNLVGNTTNWNLFLLPGNNSIQTSVGTNQTTTLTAYHAFSM